MQDMNQDHAGHQSPAVNAHTQDGSVPSPSFSVFRFRQMSEQGAEFYDPVTDILRVLPAAVQSTLETLEPILDSMGLLGEGCVFANNLHNFCEIRAVEQKDPIDFVLKEYMEVFNEAPITVRLMFTETLFINLMVMYTVAQRRTSQNQPKKILDIEDTLRLGSVLTQVSDNTRTQVLKDLARFWGTAINMVNTPASDEKIGFVDDHYNVILSDAKDFVAKTIPVKDGPRAWSTIAAILDQREVTSAEDQAIKETYPNYKRHNENAEHTGIQEPRDK